MSQPAEQILPQAAESQAPELRHAPMPTPLGPRPDPADLKLDCSRDGLLTDFGRQTLQDR